MMANFWNKTPQEFKNICTGLGLSIISSHYKAGRSTNAFGTLANGWSQAVEHAATMQIPYMVCAWLEPDERVSVNEYSELCQLLNKAGETCKAHGIQLCYHGHDFEFYTVGSIIPYQFILENTDQDLVKMEPDMYWMWKAGEDPVKWFEAYPGRFPLWHLKDMQKDTQNFTELGNGVIDFKRLFNFKNMAGLQHCFVEQDESQDAFRSIEISKDYLATMYDFL